MIDEVYNARILELAGNIGRIGRLAAPSASATRQSRLCGSKITVDITMAGGVVTDYAHDVKACALGQAAAAVMAKSVVGATAADLRAARDALQAMLKDGGDPPVGRFGDLAVLLPVREFKARHTSTMLAFDAVVACLDEIEAAPGADSA